VEVREGGDRGDRYVLKQIARFFETLLDKFQTKIELACCVVRRRLC
jgi:hypothetical protein